LWNMECILSKEILREVIQLSVISLGYRAEMSDKNDAIRGFE